MHVRLVVTVSVEPVDGAPAVGTQEAIAAEAFMHVVDTMQAGDGTETWDNAVKVRFVNANVLDVQEG